MKQFFTVMSFEFNKMLKTTAYKVMTIIVLLVIIIGFSLPNIISLFEKDAGEEPKGEVTKKIIYVIDQTKAADTAEYLGAVKSFENYKFEKASASQKTELTDKINIEKDNAFAMVERSATGDVVFTTKQISMTDSFVPSLQTVLAQKKQLDLMTEFGLSAEQAQKVMYTPPAFEIVQSAGKDAQSAFAFTYVLLILMFMSITMYGQMVTMSVITEKSTRTMELLITSAKADNLIFGKIIGTGLAGLAQIALFLLTMLLMYNINIASLKEIVFISQLFDTSADLLIYTIVYYLLGFFLYAFLLGALGSMCSRVEDANTMIMPAMLLLVAGFYIAIYGAVADPNSILITVCSMIPFFSPTVMLVRMGMTVVPFWQIALSIIITGAGVFFMGKLSVLIYRAGVLMYGNKPSLKQVSVALKQAKNL